MDQPGPFRNLGNGNRLSPGVARGPLDAAHLRPGTDGPADAFQVNAAIRQQIHLLIGDAEFFQRALPLAPDADHLLQGVVRTAGAVDDLVPRTQNALKGNGQSMGAVHNLGPHQCGFRVEHVSVESFQRVPAFVIIAVPGIPGEMPVRNPFFLKGGHHLVLVVGHDVFQAPELIPDPVLRCFRQFHHPGVDIEGVPEQFFCLMPKIPGAVLCGAFVYVIHLLLSPSSFCFSRSVSHSMSRTRSSLAFCRGFA